MSKAIRFNAFEMNCVGHQSPGLWRHPRDISWQYKDLEYWTNLAKLLEQGFFDAIFIADVIGYYDVYQSNLNQAFRQAVQIPVNDPLQLINPIALVTEHLGIGFTASCSFEHPYTFARRLSTADHHTKGRVGWNIVTSYLESGAKNIGQSGLQSHDQRYRVAAEYLEVLYKLLEGSWENGSVLRDKVGGLFIDPDKVHAINHKGRYFEVPGYHLCEPSPQRTPVLFQAGASNAGKQFAAQHAECVFISNPSAVATRAYVTEIRQQTILNGRDPKNVLVYAKATIIVDETDAKALAKHQEYSKYASYDGALVLISGWTGIDFSQFKPTETVKKVQTNAIVSAVERLSKGEKDPTVEELARDAGIGGLGPLFVGSASTVADLLEAWVETTGIDGFNLAYVVAHETFQDVIDFLVPELQKRGVYATNYKAGTLREKLFDAGPYLPENHPANQFRDLK